MIRCGAADPASATSGGAWSVEWARGAAGEHHGRPLPAAPRRLAWLFRIEQPALVLGSGQPAEHVDPAAAARAGMAVVRRRSGGGAVLLQPEALAWCDLLVPRGDPLWDDDVGRATWWVGETWASVLADLGFPAEVHKGGMLRRPWSDRVCFAGLGPGEVTVAGRKVVGISQRRVRDQARFQCAALLAWRPGALVDVLSLDEPARRRCRAEVAEAAAGLHDLTAGAGGGDARIELSDLEARLVAALPS